MNWALRYEPVVQFLRTLEARPRYVLEVGSGPQGVIRYIDFARIIGVDLRFSTPAHPLLVRVQASGEKLPFPTDTFPVVIACDLLEHVPPPMRGPVLLEMLRVAANYLVLAYPSGPLAEAADVELSQALRRRRIEVPSWLAEHHLYPYPTSSEVANVLGDRAVVTRVERNTSLWLHRLVLLGEHLRGWNRVLALLDRIAIVSLLRHALHLPPTYREVVIVRKVTSRLRTPLPSGD